MKALKLSRSKAAKLLNLSRPTLIEIGKTNPELEPTVKNRTSVEYSIEQLAKISKLYEREPNQGVAAELGIPRHQLLDFYCDLPVSQTPTPSPSDFSACNNLALSICEQLRMLADGTFVELPRNLQRILRVGLTTHRSKIFVIASMLADIDTDQH